MTIKVAFVACNKNARRFGEDPSYVYRCENLGRGLEELGCSVDFVHLSRLAFHPRPDVAVFHRPRDSWLFRALLRTMRLRGTRVLADVDDLIFVPELAAFSPGVVNERVSHAETVSMYRLNRAALERFDAFTVSTRALADALESLFPDARVKFIPNAVHHLWCASPLPTIEPAVREPRLTYFPGTRSHDRDFALIADEVGALLAKYPDLKLEITGFLDLALKLRPEQLIRHERLPFGQYVNRVRDGWINLSPLVESPFNRCKSALKVIEAGFWDIPTICSPTPDAERFVDRGALVARAPGEVFDIVESLLNDGASYRKLTDGLRMRTLHEADIHSLAREWMHFVEGELPQ